MKTRDRSPRARLLRLSAIVAFIGLYLGLADVANQFAMSVATSSPWWPPAALTFVVFLRKGWRAFGVVWLAEMISDVILFHVPVAWCDQTYVLVRDTSLSRLGYLCAAMLTVRVLHVDPRLRRPRDIVGFVLGGAVVGASLSTASGVLSAYWGRTVPTASLPSYGADWWAGDAVAVVALGSTLAMVGLVPMPDWRSVRSPEALLQMALVVAGPLVAVRFVGHESYLFLCFLPLTWVAIRRSLVVTALAASVINVTATFVLGRDPSTGVPLADLQMFMATLTLTALVLGAVVGQIQDLNRDLEHRVVERTAQLADANEHLEHQATHDALTGLANRSLFEARLARVLDGPSHGDHDPADVVGVLLLDLDGFKQVNDTYGHHAGDDVLTTVAGRLRRCVREDHTVARLGGDEFAIVVGSNGGPSQLDGLARRIGEMVGEPIEVATSSGSVAVTVGASIGVASSDGPGDPVTLLRTADERMYATKRTRRALLPAAV